MMAFANSKAADRPSAAAHATTEWLGAPPRERGDALKEVLLLADALPQRLRPEGAPSLPEKVISVHRALAAGEVPHAIGGAIALAYYGEPRVTIDIDVNVFLRTDDWTRIRDALAALGIDSDVDEKGFARDNEVRLGWDRNLVHLFFSEDALHVAMPATVREVPFAGTTIPIVSPEHLIVRKAMLDRPKDWLDIEAILVATEPLDVAEIRAWLGRLAGAEDPRLAKFEGLHSRLVS